MSYLQVRVLTIISLLFFFSCSTVKEKNEVAHVFVGGNKKLRVLFFNAGGSPYGKCKILLEEDASDKGLLSFKEAFNEAPVKDGFVEAKVSRFKGVTELGFGQGERIDKYYTNQVSLISHDDYEVYMIIRDGHIHANFYIEAFGQLQEYEAIIERP